MEIPLTQALAACEQCAARIDDILRHADRLPLRASRIAELLHALWPSSPVYGCLLEAVGESHLCVLDQGGKPRVEWAERLRSSMQEAGKRIPEDAASLAKLPQAMKLPGHALATVAITFRTQNWGALAIAVPEDVSAETFALLRVLLGSGADHLAATLDAETSVRQLEALKKEGEEQNWLANTGEMAGPLAHEVNNFLNVVLLHVALIEAELPQKLRSELTELRRQAAGVTATVKQFQQIRRRRHPVPEPVDINQQVGDAVRSLTDSSEPNQPLAIKLPPSSRIETTGLGRPAAVPLHLVLAPDLSPILGSAADLKRLCTFLLNNAAHAAGPVGGSVTIRTEASGSNVVLRVEDDGPSVPPELLPQLFEPSTMGRAHTSSLELAACETLVRRLHGKIRCENRAEQGLAVIAELPKA